jgi:hypothetical protein
MSERTYAALEAAYADAGTLYLPAIRVLAMQALRRRITPETVERWSVERSAIDRAQRHAAHLAALPADRKTSIRIPAP